MAEQSQVDEFQDDKGGQQPIISPEQAARNHKARENIYIGEDELKERQDESQRNNASQILSGTYSDEQWTEQHEERFQSLERGYLSGNLTAEQRQDRDYMKHMRPANEPTKDKKLERIIKNEISKKMQAGRTQKIPPKIHNTRAKAKQETPRQQRYSNRETLQEEMLRVGKQKKVEAKKPQPVLSSLPPNSKMPNVIQGQPNDERKPPTSSSNSRNFPTKEKVKRNEDVYRPEKIKLTRQDIEDRKNEMRAKMSGVAGLYDQLIDKMGGVEAFIDSVESLIEGGVLPERILSDAVQRLYPKASGEALDGALGEASGGVLDEEKFRAILGEDVPPEKVEELVKLASEIMRSGGGGYSPDKGGAPLSRGLDGEGKHDDTMSVDSLEVASPELLDKSSIKTVKGGGTPGGGMPPSSGGMPPDAGGMPKNGGGGSFSALQKMNSIAPQIASLLLNNRPLLIKKEDIPQIYPPLPKNTNLKIVQQAIARSEEDASILNVYFN